MNLETARRVADTMLYEGYVLYPYRASAQKNRSRWQFGVVMPAAYAAADPSETAATRTECVLAYADAMVDVVLRFLQVQRRTVVGGSAPDWDEAVEQEIRVTTSVEALAAGPVEQEFLVAGGVTTEQLPGEDSEAGDVVEVVRRREPLAGVVRVTGRRLPGQPPALRLRVDVENRSPCTPGSRDDALPAALVAAHTILSVDRGEFVSMVDPPAWAASAVAECENTGGWPVLAGTDGAADVMLCAPIILYDHPEIAAESPGDLYDATEIDEILTLRTLALTDEEKREARATDPRAAEIIDRTESLDAAAFERLHGVVRDLRAVPAPMARPDAPWWDPEADASVSPGTDAIVVAGREVSRGSTVLLRPGARRADAQDMFLVGRLAQVEAVLFDVDDQPYIAVSLADDPAADMQRAHGRFLYFAPDEVEPVEAQP